MLSLLNNFGWGVFDSYHIAWRDELDDNERVSVPYLQHGRAPTRRSSPPRADGLRHYRPFEDTPQLYLDFAHLAEESPEDQVAAILRFAKKFGQLALVRLDRPLRDAQAMAQFVPPREALHRVYKRQSTTPVQFGGFGERRAFFLQEEPLALWVHEAAAMTQILRLLALADDETPDGPIRADVSEAHEILIGKMTAYTENTVAPPDPTNPNAPRFEGVTAPVHLLGALWLQLFEALEAGARYRPCRVCGTFMEIRDARQHGKTYCRDRCQKRAVKKRSVGDD